MKPPSSRRSVVTWTGASPFLLAGACASARTASPELTAALLETRASEDLDARKAAFAKVQKIVVDLALVVPLVFQLELDAHVAKVKGYRPNLLGKPRFDGVWLDG